MPTPPDIEQATSICSFGLSLEKYYLQLGTIGVAFDENTQSRFFLSALQQKGIENNRFVDHLNNVPEKDPLPEELTLTELILRIKDIRSLHNSSTVSPVAPRNRHLHIRMTFLLTSLATQMLIPARFAKLDLITALLTQTPDLLVCSINAHRRSAFVAAGAALWKIVNRLRCTS
jgi:hypothetical protein